MLNVTSLKHPTTQAAIKAATRTAIQWAQARSDSYTSCKLLVIGNHSLFIRANNKGRVVAVQAYNDKTGKSLGNIVDVVAASL